MIIRSKSLEFRATGIYRLENRLQGCVICYNYFMKIFAPIILILMIVLLTSGCGTRITKVTLDTDNLHVQYPYVKGLKDKSLQTSINDLIYKTAFKLKDNYYMEVTKNKDSYRYYVEYAVTYRDRNILSMKFLECLSLPFYAHPINEVHAITIDLNNGSLYSLKDLFKQGISWKPVLNGIIKGKIDKNKIKLLDEFKGIDKEQGFFLTDDSVAIYWQEAVYLPRYMGPFTVMIEKKALEGLMIAPKKIGPSDESERP
jgi:hypothetical protein